MEFLTLSEMLNNPQIAAEAQRYLDEHWQRNSVIPSVRSQGEYTFYVWPVCVWRRKLAERVAVRVWQCEACARYFGIKAPKPGHVVYWNRNCPGCREPLSDAIQRSPARPRDSLHPYRGFARFYDSVFLARFLRPSEGLIEMLSCLSKCASARQRYSGGWPFRGTASQFWSVRKLTGSNSASCDCERLRNSRHCFMSGFTGMIGSYSNCKAKAPNQCPLTGAFVLADQFNVARNIGFVHLFAVLPSHKPGLWIIHKIAQHLVVILKLLGFFIAVFPTKFYFVHCLSPIQTAFLWRQASLPGRDKYTHFAYRCNNKMQNSRNNSSTKNGAGGKHQKPWPVSTPGARSTARSPSLPRAGGRRRPHPGHDSSKVLHLTCKSAAFPDPLSGSRAFVFRGTGGERLTEFCGGRNLPLYLDDFSNRREFSSLTVQADGTAFSKSKKYLWH